MNVQEEIGSCLTCTTEIGYVMQNTHNNENFWDCFALLFLVGSRGLPQFKLSSTLLKTTANIHH